MRILRCPRCGTYTLKERCPRCGSKTVVAAPPKFSLNGRRAELLLKARLRELGLV